MGLPQCIAIERELENGCELHSACCGVSGIMCQLKIHKTASANAVERQEAGHDKALNAGTVDLKDLICPWAKSNRLVVADSAFASVQCAQELFALGLRFIGVIKTATKDCPMQHLLSAQLKGRGGMCGMCNQVSDLLMPTDVLMPHHSNQMFSFTHHSGH